MAEIDAIDIVIDSEGPSVLDEDVFVLRSDSRLHATALGLITGPRLSEWPTSYRAMESYPDNVGLDWMGGAGKRGLQGVTHDESNWFLTTKGYIWKVPVETDLEKNFSIPDDPVAWATGRSDALENNGILRVGDKLVRGIPVELAGDYDHCGDPDCHDGILYVPLEAKEGAGLRPRIAVFRAQDLLLIAVSDPLPEGASGGFCSINPLNGNLYVFGSDHPASLAVFELSIPRIGRTLERSLVQTIPLGYDQGSYHQGGAFSPGGHFYFSCGLIPSDYTPEILGGKGGIVSDRPALSRWNGILAFDLATAQIKMTVAIPKVWDYEVEGITVWDLEDGRAPGIRGQVHLLIRNHDWPSTDNLIFAHFRVPSNEVSLV